MPQCHQNPSRSPCGVPKKRIVETTCKCHNTVATRSAPVAWSMRPRIHHNASSVPEAFSMISWQPAERPRSRFLPLVAIRTSVSENVNPSEREGCPDQALFRLSLSSWRHLARRTNRRVSSDIRRHTGKTRSEEKKRQMPTETPRKTSNQSILLYGITATNNSLVSCCKCPSRIHRLVLKQAVIDHSIQGTSHKVR